MRAALLVLMLAGCANGRYLTEQEDAEMRKNCEVTGCVAVPVPIFEKIMQILKAIGSTRI